MASVDEELHPDRATSRGARIMSRPRGRRELGIQAARVIEGAAGYAHPTDVELEVLAFIRGALVRSSPARGARANLLRVDDRGIIGVAEGLSLEERRWAIAHELGHFEVHANESFIGLCSGSDMVAAYRASGLEEEANAFAAELLLPERLVRGRCLAPVVAWATIAEISEEFCVSMTAAALRFVALTSQCVALVVAKDGRVVWSASTPDFGRRPGAGVTAGERTRAQAFFTKGKTSPTPETIGASAWFAEAEASEAMREHVFPVARRNMTMSLLWRDRSTRIHTP